jgi:hypothetical protein
MAGDPPPERLSAEEETMLPPELRLPLDQISTPED